MKKLNTATLALLMIAGVAQAQSLEAPKQTTDFYRATETGDRETANYVTSGESWAGGVVTWWYNPQGQPWNMTTQTVLHALNLAMNRWSQMCKVTFYYLGTTTANRNLNGASVDNKNVVGWGSFPASMSDSSAITHWNYRGTQMLDADITLNSWVAWTSRDIDAVVTHEVGHMLGIQHSDTANSVMSAAPYNSYEFQRTLRGDDAAACAKLYGASSSALVNRTMNWAETHYADLLKGGPAETQINVEGMLYRYYPAVNSYVGVTKGGIAYYAGPTDRMMSNVGALSNYTADVVAGGF